MAFLGIYFPLYQSIPFNFSVPKGESDMFDAFEAGDHIKIGTLAFGKPENKLALLITLSDDAILVLKRLGHLYDLDTLE